MTNTHSTPTFGIFKATVRVFSLSVFMLAAGCSSNLQTPPAQGAAATSSTNSTAMEPAPDPTEQIQQNVEEFGLVVIDISNPAYAVVFSQPESVKAKLEALPANELAGFSTVATKDFIADPQKYLGSMTRINSYPDHDFYNRFASLVVRYPTAQFGLAFNGGIAITYNDFLHTQRMYRTWLKDPDLYREIQTLPENQPKDPIKPESHFSGLLGAAKSP